MIRIKELSKIDNKYYATLIINDNFISFEKVKELLESENYLDKEGKTDTGLFLSDVSNEREYVCSLIISDNELLYSSCTCLFTTFEMSKNTKSNKVCKHIKFLMEHINEK